MGLIRPAGLIRQAAVRDGPPRGPDERGPDGRPGGPRQAAARIPASALVLTGVISLQLGAGFAAKLFTQVPATAVTALRLWTAGLLLAIASARGLRAAVAGL
ncbi:MAG: hypothetical protein J2P32_07250, partial [Actinobacteria bacterium]|nr:hypothetical protein [Actinomycetota bacterium]